MLIVTAVVMMAVTIAAAEDATRQAEKLYAEGDYTAALEAYVQEESQNAGAARWFNEANCHYRLGQYDEAAGLYRRAAACEDERLAAQSNYNLGNALYQQGLAAQQEPQKALELLEQAARSYRRARDKSGPLAGARNNLALTRGLMQQIIEQMQQEDNQQQDKQDQQEQQQQDQQQQEQQQQEDQQNQQQQEQQQSEQEKQDQQEQQKQEKAEQQQKDDQQEQQQQQAQEQQAEQKEPDDEVKQAAQQILDQEKERREERRLRAVGVVPVERDW